MPHGMDYLKILGYSLNIYLVFRGGALVLHNLCCWILVKCGCADYKKDPDA